MSEELMVIGILKGFLKDCDNDVLGLARNVYEIALKEVLALEKELAEAKENVDKLETIHQACDKGCLKLQLTASQEAGEKMRTALRDYWDVLNKVAQVACGEDQIECDGDYNDSDGMQWIYAYITDQVDHHLLDLEALTPPKPVSGRLEIIDETERKPLLP